MEGVDAGVQCQRMYLQRTFLCILLTWTGICLRNVAIGGVGWQRACGHSGNFPRDSILEVWVLRRGGWLNIVSKWIDRNDTVVCAQQLTYSRAQHGSTREERLVLHNIEGSGTKGVGGCRGTRATGAAELLEGCCCNDNDGLSNGRMGYAFPLLF